MQTVFKYIYMFYTFRRPHFAGSDIHFIQTQTIICPHLPDNPKAWQPPIAVSDGHTPPSAIFLYTCRKTIPLFPFMPERPSEKTFNVKEVIFLRYCALSGFTLYCRTLRLRNIANRLSEEKKENSMAQITLDKTDLKILQVLQSNGRLTNVELSERVALSPSPCLRRLKQLEDAGIILFRTHRRNRLPAAYLLPRHERLFPFRARHPALPPRRAGCEIQLRPQGTEKHHRPAVGTPPNNGIKRQKQTGRLKSATETANPFPRFQTAYFYTKPVRSKP